MISVYAESLENGLVFEQVFDNEDDFMRDSVLPNHWLDIVVDFGSGNHDLDFLRKFHRIASLTIKNHPSFSDDIIPNVIFGKLVISHSKIMKLDNLDRIVIYSLKIEGSESSDTLVIQSNTISTIEIEKYGGDLDLSRCAHLRVLKVSKSPIPKHIPVGIEEFSVADIGKTSLQYFKRFAILKSLSIIDTDIDEPVIDFRRFKHLNTIRLRGCNVQSIHRAAFSASEFEKMEIDVGSMENIDLVINAKENSEISYFASEEIPRRMKIKFIGNHITIKNFSVYVKGLEEIDIENANVALLNLVHANIRRMKSIRVRCHNLIIRNSVVERFDLSSDILESLFIHNSEIRSFNEVNAAKLHSIFLFNSPVLKIDLPPMNSLYTLGIHGGHIASIDDISPQPNLTSLLIQNYPADDDAEYDHDHYKPHLLFTITRHIHESFPMLKSFALLPPYFIPVPMIKYLKGIKDLSVNIMKFYLDTDHVRASYIAYLPDRLNEVMYQYKKYKENISKYGEILTEEYNELKIKDTLKALLLSIFDDDATIHINTIYSIIEKFPKYRKPIENFFKKRLGNIMM